MVKHGKSNLILVTPLVFPPSLEEVYLSIFNVIKSYTSSNVPLQCRVIGGAVNKQLLFIVANV